MKLRTLLAVAATTAVVAPIASVTPGRADPPVVNPKGGLPRVPAPLTLDPAKRALKFGAILKAMGIPQSPPQTLEMRLTPVAPRLPNGAQIVRAGLGTMNGSDVDEPDGSFVLQRTAGAMIAMASVEMRIPTEAGKLYVLDCRVKAAAGSNPKFTVTRGSDTTAMTPDDGHLMTAFYAKSAQTEISVMASGSGSDNILLAYFYGCDFGKAS